MATRKPKRKKELSYFYDHVDQEAKDLAYGDQKPGCKKYIGKDTTFADRSTGEGWTPDED